MTNVSWWSVDSLTVEVFVDRLKQAESATERRVEELTSQMDEYVFVVS